MTADKNLCATYHAADEPYWKKVHYWTTPIAAVPRRPHERQVRRRTPSGSQAWTEIKG